MRRKITGDEKDLFTKIMHEEGSSYQKVATVLGISRQAARQVVQKPVASMRVSSLLRVSHVFGYHLELVREEGEAE